MLLPCASLRHYVMGQEEKSQKSSQYMPNAVKLRQPRGTVVNKEPLINSAWETEIIAEQHYELHPQNLTRLNQELCDTVSTKNSIGHWITLYCTVSTLYSAVRCSTSLDEILSLLSLLPFPSTAPSYLSFSGLMLSIPLFFFFFFLLNLPFLFPPTLQWWLTLPSEWI